MIIKHQCTNEICFVSFPDTVLQWIGTAQQLSTCQLLVSFPSAGSERELEEQNQEKFMGSGEDSLIHEVGGMKK